MRVLVTGGAGFIGANFVHYCLSTNRSCRVVVLDAVTYAGNMSSLQALPNRSDFRFVRGDIRDEGLVEQLLIEESIDTIVHFSAESHVDRSIESPHLVVETNVLRTHSLLCAARRVWLSRSRTRSHRFHHVSTDEVYGSLGPDDAPFTESSPYAPNSPYSASKAASDHLVRAYHQTYGLQITLSNCSNNYGPYQFPEKLIPLTILCILGGKGIPVYGDGLHRRDWLNVIDHCRALDLILTHGKSGEVYNIGGRSEHANIDLITSLCKVADELFANSSALRRDYLDCPAARGMECSSLITPVPDRPGHDRRYSINCDKIQQQLGFCPSIPFARGLRETFIWYLQNKWWWCDAPVVPISWAQEKSLAH